jgi:hypothetical protein
MQTTSRTADYLWSPEPGPDLKQLALQARAPDTPPRERDAVLRQVVLAYRDDRTWGPLLVELLRPMVWRLLGHLEAQPRLITEDDLEHQIVVELLLAARWIPLSAEQRFVDRAIVRRAGRRVSRWLAREEERLDSSERLHDEDDDLEAEDDE